MNKKKFKYNIIEIIKPKFLNIFFIKWIPILFLYTIIFLLIKGIDISLSGPDFQQGNHFLLIYIHVPSAWLGLLFYLLLVIFNCLYLIKKIFLFTHVAYAFSVLGANFTLITLFTGSLWGYPIWGTYWVWDARLTSMLVLFFLYIADLIIRDTSQNEENNIRLASYLSIFGIIDIPIVRFSVDWWNTLHQSSSVSLFKNTIDPIILNNLLSIFLGFSFISMLLIILIVQKKIYLQKKKALLIHINILEKK
jgi:heme exporter protein C